MEPALARHDAILNQAVESMGGRVVKATGDGIHAAFPTAQAAVAAALSAQLALGRWRYEWVFTLESANSATAITLARH
jgi:class 3 adenylate cyclase